MTKAVQRSDAFRLLSTDITAERRHLPAIGFRSLGAPQFVNVLDCNVTDRYRKDR